MCTVGPIVLWSPENAACDPGSELLLGWREQRRAKVMKETECVSNHFLGKVVSSTGYINSI